MPAKGPLRKRYLTKIEEIHAQVGGKTENISIRDFFEHPKWPILLRRQLQKSEKFEEILGQQRQQRLRAALRKNKSLIEKNDTLNATLDGVQRQLALFRQENEALQAALYEHQDTVKRGY